MTEKSYEKKSILKVFIVIDFVLLLIFVMYITNKKINSFINFEGVIKDKGRVEILVNNKYKDLIYKNSSLYYNDKKYMYTIENVNKDVVKKKKDTYTLFELGIEIKKNKNEIVNLVFNKKRINVYEIFKIIWKGD